MCFNLRISDTRQTCQKTKPPHFVLGAASHSYKANLVPVVTRKKERKNSIKKGKEIKKVAARHGQTRARA